MVTNEQHPSQVSVACLGDPPSRSCRPTSVAAGPAPARPTGCAATCTRADRAGTAIPVERDYRRIETATGQISRRRACDGCVRGWRLSGSKRHASTPRSIRDRLANVPNRNVGCHKMRGPQLCFGNASVFLARLRAAAGKAPSVMLSN